MSTFVLERDGRLERHRTESRVLKGLARAFSFALPLACAVGTWMVLLQLLEGAHTTNEPGLLVQILRAVTTRSAGTAHASSGALAVSERLCSAAHVGPRLRAATTSTILGIATAAVFAAWHPVHSWLFGGYVHYSGAELAPTAYMLRDGILALAVALPVAAVIVLLARRRAAAPRRANASRARPDSRRSDAGPGPRRPGHRRMGGSVAAGAGALGACPANAPMRHFDVQAIDVRITLNRFGDNDPFGKMYVLSNRVAAVRTQEAVAHGLHGPAQRRHPAARDPRQRGRLRRDRVHQQRHRRRVRHPCRRPRVRHRVVGRPGRPERLVGPGPRRQHDVPLLHPERPEARGRASAAARARATASRSHTASSDRSSSSPRARPGWARTASRSPPAGRP